MEGRAGVASRLLIPGLLALTMVGVTFAGCLGSSANGGKIDNLSTTNQSQNLSTVLPQGRTGTMTAYNETTTVDSMGMHSHDYWNGRTRVDIFKNVHTIMGPFVSPNGTAATFRPPPGALIFEGTDHIEVTIANAALHACLPLYRLNSYPMCDDSFGQAQGPAPSAPDPQPSSTLKLQYITASGDNNHWQDAGAIGWGAPVTIKITQPIETDMPHSTGSLWQFRIVSSSPQDAFLEFDVSATIVRGTGEIPLWPAHPLFYARTHYRTIFDGTQSTQESGGPQGFARHSGEPSKLISGGTNTLLVFANITSVNAPSKPTDWYMWYHNASYTGWNETGLDSNHTGDKTHLAWVLRSDMNGMDSPYATNSRWEFVMRGAFQTPVLTFLGGGPPYSVTYHLTVIATDLIPPHYDSSGPG
jgi:hypothetical protein